MSKRYIAPLEKGFVRLRLLEKADLPMTLSWRNRNRKWFLNQNPLSLDQHKAWFEQYVPRDDDYVFIIERRAEKIEPVGQISLYKIDWKNQKAEFGRLLIGERKARRLGIAKKATEILLNYSFVDLAIRSIQLEVLKTNKPAIALYGSCGFAQIAIRDNIITMSKSGWIENGDEASASKIAAKWHKLDTENTD
jgi:RimJ/RimL family protein N-acetyltransferase